MEAADEIGLAVIATTLTLIAVFLPTAFMGGIVGPFFMQFGWTAAIAVFFSLVVARMLTPMMAAYLLKAPKPDRRRDAALAADLPALGHLVPAPPLGDDGRRDAVLRRRVHAGAAVADRLHAARRPVADAGARHAATRRHAGGDARVAESARAIVNRHAQVRQVYTAIGGGASGANPFAAPGQADVRKAVLTINMTPRSERPGLSKQDVEAQLRDGARGAARRTAARSASAARAEKYVLVLASDDGRVLTEHAARSSASCARIPGIGGVTSTASLVRPELIVRPDFARMADPA